LNALHVTGLEKTFSGLFGRQPFQALRGVDLTIPQGTAFGLIGQNGAGKTTFIKSLLGIIRPTGGEVSVLGGHPEDPRIRARIGYLPERLHLPEAWRAGEFLASVGRLKRTRLSKAATEALLARVGLQDIGRRRIGGFSKGMRQRLGLAAALIGAPELLILDEPTDGVDPLGRVEIRRILSEEVARGATLFLNSHLLAETERVCTRIGILDAGRLVREGSLASLRREGRSWTVRFAPGANADALTAAGFTVEGASWRCEAASVEALNAALDRARAAGALLLSLQPSGGDLEQVLAETLEAA
jgi:ABC-2 type transport system ATP-binding protein